MESPKKKKRKDATNSEEEISKLFRRPVLVARRVVQQQQQGRTRRCSSSPSKIWKGSLGLLEEDEIEKETSKGIHSKKDNEPKNNTLLQALDKLGEKEPRRAPTSKVSTSTSTSSISSLEGTGSEDGKNKSRNRRRKLKKQAEQERKKLIAEENKKKESIAAAAVITMGPYCKNEAEKKGGSNNSSSNNSKSKKNSLGAVLNSSDHERRKAIDMMMKAGAVAASGAKRVEATSAIRRSSRSPVKTGKKDEQHLQNFNGSRRTIEPTKRELPLPSSAIGIGATFSKNFRIPKTVQKTGEEPSRGVPVGGRKSNVGDNNAGNNGSPAAEIYNFQTRCIQSFQEPSLRMKEDNASPNHSSHSNQLFAPGIKDNRTLLNRRNEKNKRKRLGRTSPVVEDLVHNKPIQVFAAQTFETQPSPPESTGCDAMEWNQLPEIFRMVSESVDPVPQSEVTQWNRDVEMEDMDVDIDEPVPNKQLVIVPDTNIFISCLTLLRNLVDTQFSKVSFPTIVIPWMVLQELDHLSHNNDANAKKKIRPAVNTIHSFLSTRHPRVRGQKASEALISKHKFDELFADDSILNCVMQLQSINTLAIFLTNDTNLRNKALVNGVIACDSNTIFQTINSLVNDGQNNSSEALSGPAQVSSIVYQNVSPPFRADLSVNYNRNNSPFSQSTNGQECFPSPSSLGNNMRQPSTVCHVKLDTTSDASYVFRAVLETLSCIIRHKMIEDFGENGWEYALKIKPPWTLVTAVNCILKHWLANFSFVFHRKGEVYLERLSNLLQRYERSNDIQKAEIERNIIETCLSIFNLMTNDISNLPAVIECRKTLMDFVIAHGY